VTKNLGWRGAAVALLILLALLYLTPSFGKDLPAWWSSFFPRDVIHLGLDLQGGVHLVLEVEAAKAVETNLERALEELKHDLRKNKIRYLELKRNGTDGIGLTLMRVEDEKPLQDMIEASYRDFGLQRGASKGQGVAFQLTLNDKAKDQIMKMATDQALETIRIRMGGYPPPATASL